MAVLTRTAFIALFTAFGCQRSPTFIDVVQHSSAVHALLVAGSDNATAVITRPVRADKQVTGMERVANARVRLVHGSDTIALNGIRECLHAPNLHPRAVESGSCYTGHVPGGVRAGGTYELLVDIAGEAAIHGTNRVPFPPQILEPNAAAEPPLLRTEDHGRPPTRLAVRWSWSTADRPLTELRISAADCVVRVGQPEQPYRDEYVAVIGTDSATLTASFMDCDEGFVYSRSGHLVVTVYDANYTHYSTASGYRRPTGKRTQVPA